MSYFLLNYLPLIILAFLIEGMEGSDSILLKIFFNLCALVFLFGTFTLTYTEIMEIKSDWRQYFKNIENYY